MQPFFNHETSNVKMGMFNEIPCDYKVLHMENGCFHVFKHFLKRLFKTNLLDTPAEASEVTPSQVHV